MGKAKKDKDKSKKDKGKTPPPCKKCHRRHGKLSSCPVSYFLVTFDVTFLLLLTLLVHVSISVSSV